MTVWLIVGTVMPVSSEENMEPINISLIMRPQDPVRTWEEFLKTAPPFSIAIDGYVADGPRFEAKGPYANFNHHEKVDRLATRSTCAQVLMAIRQDFFVTFSENNMPKAVVYANDCDEDVCVSWFLLNHRFLADNVMFPPLNRLVHMEDMLDATAGAYPFPPYMPILQELAWVFEPYRRFRLSGELDKRNPESFTGVVTDIELRIMQHIMGSGKSLSLDVRYDSVGGGKHWSMIKEIGAQAKTGMFADRIHAYVSLRERPQGGFSYTVGRMSPFVPFDVPKILVALTAAETNGGHWGGGNTIGGSDRALGSALLPDEVEKIVEASK